VDPAIAALLGSVAGGSASLATAFMNLRAQERRVAVQTEMHKREILYTDFISECSKLALDALDHMLDRPETLQAAYTLVNRIRLTSSDAVLHAAEDAIQEIVARYRAPNLPIEKLREISLAEIHDPIKAFSDACRNELRLLRQERM
jgi:hypothetical protein